MVTNMISQLQESFPLRRAAGSFEKKLSFMYEFHQYLENKQNITWPLGDTILPSSAESISHEWAKRTCERYIHTWKIKTVFNLEIALDFGKDLLLKTDHSLQNKMMNLILGP